MYRHQKMIREFEKMPELERYYVDRTAIRKIFFCIHDNDEKFIVEILRGAYIIPILYKIEENKRQRRVDKESVSSYVKDTYEKIKRVMDTANKPYKDLLPEGEFKIDQVVFKSRNFVEVIVDGDIMISPDQVFIYLEMYFGGAYVGELEVELELKNKNECPSFEITKSKFEKSNSSDIPVTDSLLEKTKIYILSKMNKPFRARKNLIFF